MQKNNKPSACPVCDSTKIRPRSHPSFSNALWRCGGCGLIFVWPQPSREELEKIYGNNYFQNNKSQDYGYDNYRNDKQNIVKTFEKRLSKIEKLSLEKGRILDVGCALGYFVEVAEKSGWDAQGIDISDYAISVAKEDLGDRVVCGVLEDNIFPKNYFDVVVSWDCIEHVTDPVKQVKLSNQILKNGGLLVMATPDSGSVVAKAAGNKWMGYKDMEHLFYFSRKSLKILLEKNGFKIVKMHTTGKYISMDLFIRRLALYNKFMAKIIDFVGRIYDPAKINVYVNPLDIVMVYAKKVGEQ